MSGRYPKSPNLEIFKENLMTGRKDLSNLITDRWSDVNLKRVSKRMFFIENKSDLDMGYFGKYKHNHAINKIINKNACRNPCAGG